MNDQVFLLRASDHVFLLWIDHGDSNELVGVYTQRLFAEIDQSKIEPKTHIGEYQLNQGKSFFLEAEVIDPEEDQDPEGEEE